MTGDVATAPPAQAGRPRVVLASRNEHKVVELARILAPLVPGLSPTDVVGAAALAGRGLPDPGEVAETGVTFRDNARLKARAVAHATGLPAVADDSGLCVAVLGGAPGVFSARWAGRHGDDGANLRLLLDQLVDVPPMHRAAWFACAAVLVVPVPGGADIEHVAVGRLEGSLTTRPRGSGGFGYDPVLVPTGGDRTCAELTAEEKDTLSHRGQALRALAPHLAAALEARET